MCSPLLMDGEKQSLLDSDIGLRLTIGHHVSRFNKEGGQDGWKNIETYPVEKNLWKTYTYTIQWFPSHSSIGRTMLLQIASAAKNRSQVTSAICVAVWNSTFLASSVWRRWNIKSGWMHLVRDSGIQGCLHSSSVPFFNFRFSCWWQKF